MAEIDQKVAALERRMKELERLLKLGLVSGDSDIRSRVEQQGALLGRLIGDDTLGGTLLGPFPGADSSMSVRRADSDFYIGGVLNTSIVATSVTMNADRIWLIPFYLPGEPNIIGSLSCRVFGAGGAGSKARLGLYADGNNRYPAHLLKDAGEVACDTTGIKTISLRQGLPRGLIWIAIAVNSIAPLPAFDAVNKASSPSWAVLGYNTTNLSGFTAWTVTSTYGPLPNPYPTGAVKASDNFLQFHIIFLEK